MSVPGAGDPERGGSAAKWGLPVAAAPPGTAPHRRQEAAAARCWRRSGAAPARSTALGSWGHNLRYCVFWVTVGCEGGVEEGAEGEVTCGGGLIRKRPAEGEVTDGRAGE